MKTLFKLIVVAVIFCTANVKAQSKFQAEAYAFIPVGDSKELSAFGIGVNTAYLFELSDKFKLGPSAGYFNFFGKDDTIASADGVSLKVEVDNFQFLPLTLAAKFSFTDKISLRADAGYAFGLNKDNKGGVFFSPKLGYEISDRIGMNAGYIRLTDSSDLDAHFNAISVGFIYSL